MIEITLDASIKNGFLEIKNYDELMNAIALMEDCNLELILRKKVKRRSLNQNAYYWGVVIPTIQQGIKQLGERLSLQETEQWLIEFINCLDKDFTHLFLKEKFIERISIDELTGEIIERKLSTRTLNKDDFSEYLEKVIQFANEVLEISIPESQLN